MVHVPHGPHPHVSMWVGRSLVPVLPVHLRGHEASVVVDNVQVERGSVRLVLVWQDGALTELAGRVRAVESNGRVAHLDVEGVEGDWRPFLSYVGAGLAPDPVGAA